MVTIESRVILALSAMGEARTPDLFQFFKDQGEMITTYSIYHALDRLRRAGGVRSERRPSGNWWRITS